MSINNYLQLSEGAGEDLSIQFRYGFVWEREYRLGDRVSWDPVERPSDCPIEFEVSGIAARLHEDHGLIPEFYAVRIIDDEIISVRRIEEPEYRALREQDNRRTHRLQGGAPRDG